ncbi:MAG: L-seryl-tRNA(Sec) selenium transferase [Acidobacteriota bacterium]
MLNVTAQSQALRRIPPVDQLLQRDDIRPLVDRYSRHLIVCELQAALERVREQIRSGCLEQGEIDRQVGQLGQEIDRLLRRRYSPSLQRVINATGVIIHTNVGRAPLAPPIASAMMDLAAGYSNLEYHLDQGSRGHRDLHFERRLTGLLSCQAATVCNNNAAAVFLILNTLSAGKKVLISRGELIEIGGSFRIPDVLEASGAILREVGTTNKTRISDYRKAVDGETGLLLRVHPSNYQIIGFTQRPHLSEMVDLARETGLPLVKDAGSGLLLESGLPFLRREPAVASVLAAGVDLVCFSGDKLLGGPQSGIIAGRKDFIERIRKNPLMRALRVDKLTYSALEHTLIEYEKGTYRRNLAVYRMLGTSPSEIRKRASVFKQSLGGGALEVELADGHSLVGGGSAPEEKIPTSLLRLRHPRVSANGLERRLRANRVPILARIEEDRLILDLRTVFPEEDGVVIKALERLETGLEG